MLKRSGFTMIEVMVVIAVVGILVVLTIPKLLGYTHEAQMTNIKHDIDAIEEILETEEEFDKRLMDSWEPVTKEQIREYVKGRTIYNKNGLLLDYVAIKDDDYKQVNLTFVKYNAGSKLPGEFFVDSRGHVLYKNPKAARPDSSYYFTCKIEGDDVMEVVELRIESEYEITMQNENNIIAGYRVDSNNIMIFEVSPEQKEIIGFLGKYNSNDQTITQVENVVFPSYYRFVDGEYLLLDGLASLPEFGAFYFKDGIKVVSITTDGCNPIQVIPDEVIEDEEPVQEGEDEPKTEMSLENGIYSRTDIWINKNRTEKKVPLYPYYQGYLMEPVLPDIPTSGAIIVAGPLNIDQGFMNSVAGNKVIVNGNVTMDSDISITADTSLYITGDLSVTGEVTDDKGLSTIFRRLKIFHYGNSITLDTDKFSGNIFVEDGIFNMDRKGKTIIYGTVISGGESTTLKVKSGNIELLGFIYSPEAKLRIASNNLFIDKGSVVGQEVWVDGHFKIEIGRIGNIVE